MIMGVISPARYGYAPRVSRLFPLAALGRMERPALLKADTERNMDCQAASAKDIPGMERIW